MFHRCWAPALSFSLGCDRFLNAAPRLNGPCLVHNMWFVFLFTATGIAYECLLQQWSMWVVQTGKKNLKWGSYKYLHSICWQKNISPWERERERAKRATIQQWSYFQCIWVTHLRSGALTLMVNWPSGGTGLVDYSHSSHSRDQKDPEWLSLFISVQYLQLLFFLHFHLLTCSSRHEQRQFPLRDAVIFSQLDSCDTFLTEIPKSTAEVIVTPSKCSCQVLNHKKTKRNLTMSHFSGFLWILAQILKLNWCF